MTFLDLISNKKETIFLLLATDVANHFAILNDLRDLADEGSYKNNDEDHHELALCLMITASDLSDQTKVDIFINSCTLIMLFNKGTNVLSLSRVI